jgi:hypothetical protein
MTHLRIGTDGLILYHHDYWDAGTALAELVPVLGAVLRTVRSRVSDG